MEIEKKKSIKDFLEIPYLGIRPDLVLRSGPLDHDGQRTWVLEDPVRGNNFRLGYTEGELLYRLMVEHDPDKAVMNLYATTPLRPSPAEIAVFITMFQREGLAILPKEKVIQLEAERGENVLPFFQRLVKSSALAISFHIPLLRPDTFLTKTLPLVSWLWSPFMRLIYLVCGVLGLILASQKIELYFSSVSYLFTPYGAVSFMISLMLLKIGHEFSHAYTAKYMGLHIRSMGIFFIVFVPLLYTDTTDAWKLPERRQRIWIGIAGVMFELSVGGIALLLWSLVPDGIFRSLMFFFSGTSIASSIFINLNPFMRFDGYYVLMDMWGIDNLRPRAFAMLRYSVRRCMFGWKGSVPEIHPHRRKMVLYGGLAALYRIVVAFSIAGAVYHFFIPLVGLILLIVEFYLFIIFPLWVEAFGVIKNRHYIGSKFRVVLTAFIFLVLCALLSLPLPGIEQIPCLLMVKDTTRIEAPGPGQISMALPSEGHKVKKGDLIIKITDDALVHELRKVRFDLESARASLGILGSGGEQGAYRNWLMAEEKRLTAVEEKFAQGLAMTEIRSPIDGEITEVNQMLYEGAFISKGAYLFTVAKRESHELKAFVHEKFEAGSLAGSSLRLEPTTKSLRLESTTVSDFRPLFFDGRLAGVHFNAKLREKSSFPVSYLPNDNLFDIAGGTILSVNDAHGRRPRDAYFAYAYDVENVPSWIPNGMPSRIWIWSKKESFIKRGFGKAWKHIVEKGLF